MPIPSVFGFFFRCCRVGLFVLQTPGRNHHHINPRRDIFRPVRADVLVSSILLHVCVLPQRVLLFTCRCGTIVTVRSPVPIYNAARGRYKREAEIPTLVYARKGKFPVTSQHGCDFLCRSVARGMAIRTSAPSFEGYPSLVIS